MKLTNIKMTNYLNSLKQISNKVRGKLGYAVARNIRKISEELIEFEHIKNKYIIEHGTKTEDGYYFIDLESNKYQKFLEYMQEYAIIEHEVDIFIISAEEFYNSDLTANEILELDFMIQDIN